MGIYASSCAGLRGAWVILFLSILTADGASLGGQDGRFRVTRIKNQQLFILPNMPVGMPWRRDEALVSLRHGAGRLANGMVKGLRGAGTMLSMKLGDDESKKSKLSRGAGGDALNDAGSVRKRVDKTAEGITSKTSPSSLSKQAGTGVGAMEGDEAIGMRPLRLKGGDSSSEEKTLLSEGSPTSPRKRAASTPRKATPRKATATPTKLEGDQDAMVDEVAEEGQEERSWKVDKAGDLEVLSTRESVLKRPDMWIGDVSTVIKPAFEVTIEEIGAFRPILEEGEGQGLVEFDVDSSPRTPVKDGSSAAGPLPGSSTGDDGGDLRPQLLTPTRMAAAAAASGQNTVLVARQREMRVNAGVLKTFDEIIVNAVDRQVEVEDMREIRVTINKETGELGVWNDGPGIEPKQHKSGKGLVPEVAFGEFMASTNFDDDTRQRFTGGRFGVGAKATNAWSKWFEVTTRHEASGMTYNQTWYDNMERKSPPVVDKGKKGGRGFTEIRWLPDYARFGLIEGLDADTYACMVMRVYDLCACTRESIKVTLNGVPLPFRSLTQYADLFWGKAEHGYSRDRIHFTLGDSGTQARLEVVMAVSASAHLEARGIVNGVQCSLGTHIEFVVNKVSDGLVERALKQLKKEKMKYDDSKTGLSKMKTYFRQHMALIVVALLPNPRFDGQTKEKLTLHTKEWGFAAIIDDRLIERIDKKLGLVDKVLMESEARNLALLQRKTAVPAGTSARVSIAKYQGANMAGKANRPPCYLLATEGDSAKDLAVCGMEIVGRDCYGVIPLRGVIRNVRPAKVNAKVLKDFLKNAELAAINKVLGLQYGQEYTKENVFKLLRYDHFVIFCDQDPDGAHIAGELINYFTIMFPSLLRAKPDFLMRLGTPIIRLKPKHKGDKAISFFTSAAFRTWFAQSGMTDSQLHRKYSSKYLKGLASSNEDDAHFYFSNLDKHLVRIVFKDDTDDEVVDKWFRKNRADDRKVLLSRAYDPDVCVDYSAQRISFPTYFDREYIHYPHYAIYRTIPNVMDGLKPSQRKVLYTAFKRKYREPVKVVQFAGAVLETAAYHHGDAALQGAIIAMARRYCGSNNINLLNPDGQFGSRHSNHAGAARYISAGLEKVTRLIFREEDDAILKHLTDDGQTIEPEYFLPVVPMALINGCEAGIAVGWSSFVPMYNPKDTIDTLRKRMLEYEANGCQVGDGEITGMIDASLSKAVVGSTSKEDEVLGGVIGQGGEDEEATGQAEETLDEGEGENSIEMTDDDSMLTSTASSASRRRMQDDGFVDHMVPWYDGFEGEVDRIGPHSFRLRGMAEYFEPDKKGGSGVISITELGPTLRSDALREAWKERFGPVEVKDAKRAKAPEGHQFLKDEQVFSTATKVHIDLTVDHDKLRAAAGVTNPKKKISRERLERLLGISETVSTTNVHLFDASMTMRRFATPESVMEHFFRHRLEAYERRKAHQIAEMKERVKELSNRARYCTMVHDGDLSIVKKKVAERIADLVKHDFDKMLPRGAKSVTAEAAVDPDAVPDVPTDPEAPALNGTTVVTEPSYDYLLRVSTLACTTEHSERLRKEAEAVQGSMKKLEETRPVDMWRKDLDELEAALIDFNKRKAESLNKGKPNKHKPPQHKHKAVVLRERRVALKSEREEEDKAAMLLNQDKLKKQTETRELREVKRRAKVFKSPSAATVLSSRTASSTPTTSKSTNRQLHKPKTPAKAAATPLLADGEDAVIKQMLFDSPIKGVGTSKASGLGGGNVKSGGVLSLNDIEDEFESLGDLNSPIRSRPQP